MTYSEYVEATGRFTGRYYTVDSLVDLLDNLAPGCNAVDGRFDADLHRVEGGLVIDLTPPAADLAPIRRIERDALLAQSDWVVARAVESGGAVPAPWAAYRQALRDITKQPGFPAVVQWPERPAQS